MSPVALEKIDFLLPPDDCPAVLLGSEGDDALIGCDGDEVLIGGLGNDTLTGGNGFDTFKWLAQDSGTDTVTDFVAGFSSGGDMLDFSELLVGESGGPGDLGNLLSHIDITVSGANTVLRLSCTSVPDPAARLGLKIFIT